ncbi:hypothetical protein IscW_ISCW009784 [Ixodes scapularis]|uniref:Uncharacterized protein n=1 Tax=Ixodes scapularis TaxID=6945 RepID=B7PZR8_IXOSC|nr:hypothetical protein IscW_ISCW009784 [Ixodes scapularis]|eukprot:XP_002405935.1 hypothetical protein IscW_ISCW009784 [Ixodes scapularis]
MCKRIHIMAPPPSPSPLPPSRHCSSIFFYFKRKKMLECPFSFCSSAFISFCHPISRLLLCFWHHLVSRTVRSNVPVVLPKCVFNIPLLSRNPPGGRENDDYDGIENGTKKKAKQCEKVKKKKKEKERWSAERRLATRNSLLKDGRLVMSPHIS